MKLTKNALQEMQSEYQKLKLSLERENENEAKRGGPLDSFKEAAAFSVNKQVKEARIAELARILAAAEVLKVDTQARNINEGMWFTISFNGEIRRMQLVDSLEADSLKNLISSSSPLGKSVLNLHAGDKFNFNGQDYQILSVN